MCASKATRFPQLGGVGSAVKPTRVLLIGWAVAVLAVFVGALLPVTARAEIIYDNSLTSETNYFPSAFEYGDEIGLGGIARIANVFEFEYYAELTLVTNATARIRFRLNDGPGPSGGQTPGTVIYDSGRFSIEAGYNTKSLAGFSVTVPDDFTWTVQFEGLAETIGSRAGLLFYNPPTIGESFNDFWLDGLLGWSLAQANGGYPKANFSARLYATQDISIRLSAPVRSSAGLNQLQLSGPVGRTCLILVSSDLVTWHALSRLTFTAPALTYTDPRNNLPGQYYQAALIPDDPITVTADGAGPNGAQLETSGPGGFPFALQASTDLKTWVNVATNTFTTRPVSLSDTNAASSGRRFYRVVVAP